MRLVILESPFAGDIAANIQLAKSAVRDCLARGEAPIASHLLFTQPGILRDGVPEERQLGIAAGWAWYSCPTATAVFYMNRGLSSGMAGALDVAAAQHTPVEFRYLDPVATAADRIHDGRPLWKAAAFTAPAKGTVAEGQMGRLEASHNLRAPMPGAPYQASLAGLVAAYYPTMEAAQAGAELWDAFLATCPTGRAAIARVTGH